MISHSGGTFFSYKPDMKSISVRLDVPRRWDVSPHINSPLVILIYIENIEPRYAKIFGNLTQLIFTCSKWTINTRKWCERCSKLAIKTPELLQWRRSGVFIVIFEHISHFFLVFLLLNFSWETRLFLDFLTLLVPIPDEEKKLS